MNYSALYRGTVTVPATFHVIQYCGKSITFGTVCTVILSLTVRVYFMDYHFTRTDLKIPAHTVSETLFVIFSIALPVT